MLYTINLYSDACQLFFNKTGGGRELPVIPLIIPCTTVQMPHNIVVSTHNTRISVAYYTLLR